MALALLSLGLKVMIPVHLAAAAIPQGEVRIPREAAVIVVINEAATLINDETAKVNNPALAHTPWKSSGSKSAATKPLPSHAYTRPSSKTLPHPHLRPRLSLRPRTITTSPPSSHSSRPSPTPAPAWTARAHIHPFLRTNGSPAEQPISCATHSPRLHPLHCRLHKRFPLSPLPNDQKATTLTTLTAITTTRM